MYVNKTQKVVIAGKLNSLADLASMKDIDTTLYVTVTLLGILGISEDDVPILAELRSLSWARASTDSTQGEKS